MANSVDPGQTAVCCGSTLFASILNLLVMLGNYFQQKTFSDVFFLGALRVKAVSVIGMWSICLPKANASYYTNQPVCIKPTYIEYSCDQQRL